MRNLLRFLVISEVADEFAKEYNLSYSVFKFIDDKKHEKDAIRMAFKWDETESGFDFWYDIHMQWVAYIHDVEA